MAKDYLGDVKSATFGSTVLSDCKNYTSDAGKTWNTYTPAGSYTPDEILASVIPTGSLTTTDPDAVDLDGTICASIVIVMESANADFTTSAQSFGASDLTDTYTNCKVKVTKTSQDRSPMEFSVEWHGCQPTASIADSSLVTS